MASIALMGASRAEFGASQTNSIQHEHDIGQESTAQIVKPPLKGLDEGSQRHDESEESYLVDWDGPEDPAKPLNWSLKLKWTNCTIVSFYTFITPLASSMFAPALSQVMREFHSTNSLLATFVVSIYILGYAIGPLIMAPLSEIYGRLPVYHVSNVLFVVFTVACAVSSNLGMLIAFRFLGGCVGSTPLVLGGGTISDLVRQEKRGGVMSIWAMGALVGPVIGPISGGYLAQSLGWRWVFWVIAIAAGVVSGAGFFFLRETYPQVLLARKAARLRKETGNKNFRSKLQTSGSPRTLFWRAISRPLKLLTHSPIVLILSIYAAIVYGYLYLLFTTIPQVYEEIYGFSQGAVGLAYLGIGIGMLIGLAAFGTTTNAIMKRKAQSPEGMKPEHRLPPMIIGAVCVPVGLFWYGWSAHHRAAWIVPILGTCFFGLGLIVIIMSASTYLIDAFTRYAASVTAANTVMRSLLGALLPLAGPKLFERLGLGWGCSVLAFVAVASLPAPFVLLRYGERIRTHPKLQVRL